MYQFLPVMECVAANLAYHVGEGFKHSQSGGEDQQLPPYSEEDFPALTKDLSRMKIKK
jgi:hypothetical protein